MSTEKSLDSLHASVKESKLLQYFAAFNRVVLAVAFIPSGMTKFVGNRFTQISIDNPIGLFFEGFYQTGFWYRFVGFAQLLAALLLLIPRTATLGAALFFPIVVNIMIITWSLDFTGTKYITSAMFLANLYLICWDYPKFKQLLPWESLETKQISLSRGLPFIFLWAIGGCGAFLFFAGISPGFAGFGVFAGIIGFTVGGILGYVNATRAK